MSRAGGCVRFPDGSLKYFLYNGTVDQVWPALFATSREAWDNYGAAGYPADDTDWSSAVEVDVYEDYGDGSHWRQRATTEWLLPPYSYSTEDALDEHRRLIEVPGIRDLYGAVDGCPDWVRWQ